MLSLLLCLLFAIPTQGEHRTTALTAKQSASETTLASVRRSDAADRDAQGNLRKLTAAEHMRRAAIYLSVRAFAEARAHWQTLIDNYPQDSRVPEALLGISAKSTKTDTSCSTNSLSSTTAQKKVARL
jgi:hypothetical protein